ncbi:putative RNA-directed DNA polymerase, partial [Tanacetum coccineum]
RFFEVLIGTRSEPLWQLLSKVAVLYTLEPIFTVIFVVNMNTIWEKVMSSLRAQIFGSVLIHKVEFFDKYKVVGTMCLLFVLAPQLAPILGALMLAVSVLVAVYKRSTVKVFKAYGLTQASLADCVTETFSAIRTVRSFSGEKRQMLTFEASFRHVQGTTSRDLWLSLKKAYAPHSTSREYTLKTQLLRIKMHGDETPDAYLNRAQEYADALATIGEPVKDKDLVMLVVSGFREEYNGLKTTITARQSPTAFSELHALLSDHDYMLEKTRTPIAPAFYGARSSNNNRSNNNNHRGNRNNSPEWRQAMKEEYDALMKNGTWSLVPRASTTNVVDGKWVYRLKRDKNGAIIRYKARFVAKGCRQQPGIDFHETFSPVVKSTTIRAVLSLAGFIDPQRPNHVCLLHKSLYGLKQAPRAWFERLSKALFDLGFKGSKTDPSLFIYSRGDTLLYILVYVDDIIVTGNNKGTIDNIICQLGSAFALKDLGPLNYVLGIEIVPHVSGILLSQKKYILELLQSAGLSNCNPVSSPMVTSSSLSLDDSTAFSNPVKYRQVVGSLQYVTLSRPDIAFAVNKVCQYMHAPTENHWSAVKRILRYLHGTVEHGMLIRRSSGSTLQAFTDVLWKGNPDTSLEAFSDADWAGDSDDRRSTGGFAIYLGSNLISWTARKQRTVSRSSTEAEYKALADTVAELTWLQALLHELGIRSSSTPILWCDNLGATYLSANPIFHARTKHVEIDYHFVREKVAQGDLRVQHISTHDQIADIFTKPLPTPRFLFLRSKLQVLAYQESGIKLGVFKSINESITRVAVYVSLLALYILGGNKVKAGELSVGTVASFIGYTFTLTFAVQGLVNTIGDLRGAFAATERINSILSDSEIDQALAYGLEKDIKQYIGSDNNLKMFFNDPNDKRRSQNMRYMSSLTAASSVRSLASSGDIYLEDVHFSYPLRPDVEILSGLDLTLKCGTVTALVGSSGAGKSTIVQLLARFYEPTQGRITVAGEDLRTFDKSEWARVVSIVNQEPVLFSVSVGENIAYGLPDEDVSRDDVIAAAKAANAHDFIISLPEGYDTLVGERGGLLSGGQRQRVAIARALLKNAPILILDEATSALDTVSERLVQDALNQLMKGRTTLVIAHRLSTVQNADQIALCSEGKIAELGTHSELLAKKGLYDSLVGTQRLAFE